MPDKEKKPAEVVDETTVATGEQEWVSLQEGKYGASWFVMITGLIMVAYFFYSLIINNFIMLKAIIDGEGGFSVWASSLALWLAANALSIALGSIIFIIGYSLTLKKKGSFHRGVSMLRLFGVCTGLIAVAMLVLGLWYVFFFYSGPLEGFNAKLEFYGLQTTTFIFWSSILAAVTTYCWLPKEAGLVQNPGV